MNFEEAYKKLRDGTASDEEAAYVARELENIRRINAILDEPVRSDPGIAKAEKDTVRKAAREFNRRSIIKVIVIVLCSLAAVAAIVCGILFIPANISASGQCNISRTEAAEVARACLAAEIGDEAAESFYVDYTFRKMKYVGSIFSGIYLYEVEFEDRFGNEYEITVNSESGYARITDVDLD